MQEHQGYFRGYGNGYELGYFLSTMPQPYKRRPFFREVCLAKVDALSLHPN